MPKGTWRWIRYTLMVKEWSAREARKERSDYSIKVYGSLEGKSFRAEKRRI